MSTNILKPGNRFTRWRKAHHWHWPWPQLSQQQRERWGAVLLILTLIAFFGFVIWLAMNSPSTGVGSDFDYWYMMP